jgi:hypothetical protein
MELSRYYVANINYSAINNSLNSFVLCTCKRLLLLIIIAWVGSRVAMGRRVRGRGGGCCVVVWSGASRIGKIFLIKWACPGTGKRYDWHRF